MKGGKFVPPIPPISLSLKIKCALVISFAALLAPISAEASTVRSPSTVSIILTSCDTSGLIPTSVSAASVSLIADTASAAANSDASTYYYFTETDASSWGANYSYGNIQDPTSCQYTSSFNGTVTITRGRFIATNPAFTETTTNQTDFIEYVGNTRLWDINGDQYLGAACGNLTVTHASSITQSCSSGILANYRQLTYSNSVLWRDSMLTSGTLSDQTGRAYVAVKIAKAAIIGGPPNISFVSTETYTVVVS